MSFEEKDVEDIDIEQYSKEGKAPPKGQRYKIRIDREQYTVNEECLTGREILEVAGKTPVEGYRLNQRLRGGQVVSIGYDQTVCFTEPGIERFMTIRLDQTDGANS